MYLDPKSKIAGLPALTVRGLLKKIGEHSFEVDFVVHELDLRQSEAQTLVEELISAGYLELDTEIKSAKACYKLTLDGATLSLASAAKPLTRKTAALRLDGFLQRVTEVNEDSRFLYKIKKVVLFGSYLSEKERINDIDIAVEVVPKFTPKELELRNRQKSREAEAKGKRFPSFIDKLLWPETEVLRYLKNRSRAISLHRTCDGILEKADQKVIFEEDK